MAAFLLLGALSASFGGVNILNHARWFCQ